MKTTAIITCAGSGERTGFNKNKILLPLPALKGKNCLEQCLKVFSLCDKIDQIIVTSSKKDLDEITQICKGKATVVVGGETRTQSVFNALEITNGDFVLIHDGARPFVELDLIERVIQGAKECGGAIPVSPSVCTIVSGEKYVNEYLGKNGLHLVQTPQAFKTDLIKKAFSMAEGKSFNDDGELFKTYISDVMLVEGNKNNIKLTFKEDFENTTPRFGCGFDCHRLVEGRPLILGGISIPHNKGLLGHSDADVLTHAIMDAILSSLALGDIGKLFPDTDSKYAGANSINLLKQVLSIIDEKGYKVDSVSATIMAEKPKLKPYITQLTKNLASTIGISDSMVGLGATTLEGLGFVGREEGICVHATAVVVRK